MPAYLTPISGPSGGLGIRQITDKFLTHSPLLRDKVSISDIHVSCTFCLFFFQFINQLISFHEILYESYSSGGYLEAVLVNFLPSVVTI
jgi:hypothetical protein